VRPDRAARPRRSRGLDLVRGAALWRRPRALAAHARDRRTGPAATTDHHAPAGRADDRGRGCLTRGSDRRRPRNGGRGMTDVLTPGLRKRLEKVEERYDELGRLLSDPATTSDPARLRYGMYTRYAERHRWRTEILSQSDSEKGGFKEIIFKVGGRGAYSKLKFESGVHRVQRVPKTEAQGRVHTSTATVAVLPEAEDVDLQISEDDLKIDVYRAAGKGGQGVNTTDSAVRITHIPTGE